MTKVRGRMYAADARGESKAVTRTGTRYVSARLEAPEAAVSAELDTWADGRVDLTIRDGSGTIVRATLYPADALHSVHEPEPTKDGRPVFYVSVDPGAVELREES